MPVVVLAEGVAKDKPGYMAGDFYLLPEVDVTAYYDNNIYATQRAKESDLVTVVSAALEAESQWERNSLDLGAGASIGRYLDISGEDYEDIWLKGDGEIDLSERSRIYAGAGYSVNHESRDAKESSQQQIDEPTTYDSRTLQIGLDQLLGQFELKLGVTYEGLDYDNVGTLLNDDRDRSVTGFGMRVSMPIAERTSLFAQGILNQRDYDDVTDQFGYERDSDGYNALAGIKKSYQAGHSLELYAGYLVQEYDDSRFERLSEPNYGLDLRWFPAKQTKVSSVVERSSNETTEIGSAGYLYTSLDLQLDQKMLTDVVGYLNYNYGLAEYQDVGREDTTHTVSVGVKYYLSPKIMLTGSYSHIDNDSNDRNSVSPVTGTYDYTRNLFFITLRARLVP
jgi:hypothetical protein